MFRPNLTAVVAAALLVGCSGNDAKTAAMDSAANAVVTPVPATVHVMGFEFGRALDSVGRIMGGVTDRFATRDTIIVSVKTQFVTAGSPVSARLLLNSKTIDSVGAMSTAPDSSGVGFTVLHLKPAAGRVPGSYMVEVFLNDKRESMKNLTIMP